LAVEIAVPPRRINEIVHGKRGVSADTALRLAKYFSTSERFWINLQSRYDIENEKIDSVPCSMPSRRWRSPRPPILWAAISTVDRDIDVARFSWEGRGER
jgi:transcriptional regulator with XRE-family HTH domain